MADAEEHLIEPISLALGNFAVQGPIQNSWNRFLVDQIYYRPLFDPGFQVHPSAPIERDIGGERQEHGANDCHQCEPIEVFANSEANQQVGVEC